MEAISRIQNFLTDPDAGDKKPAAPEDSITQLEHFIDKMVAAQNKFNQAQAQAAIKARMVQEEFEKRVAFLSGQLHKAESALAALEGSLAGNEKTPGDTGLLTSKRGEVAYWRTQLRQTCSPGLDDLL